MSRNPFKTQFRYNNNNNVQTGRRNPSASGTVVGKPRGNKSVKLKIPEFASADKSDGVERSKKHSPPWPAERAVPVRNRPFSPSKLSSRDNAQPNRNPPNSLRSSDYTSSDDLLNNKFIEKLKNRSAQKYPNRRSPSDREHPPFSSGQDAGSSEKVTGDDFTS